MAAPMLSWAAALLSMACLVAIQAGAADAACEASNYVIQVNSVDDLALREGYPSTSAVTLVLQRSLTLSTTLVLGSVFDCTVLSAAPDVTLTAPFDGAPALKVDGVSSLLVQGVSIATTRTALSPSPCNAVDRVTGDGLCPAVGIYNSRNVQLVGARVTGGRVDMYNCTMSELNSLMVSVEAFDKGIRIGRTGTVVPTTGNVIVASNTVSGGTVGILLHRGAIGVTVKNNYITAFVFAGIQLGEGAVPVGNAMLNMISHNYIYIPDAATGLAPETAGIYIIGHYFNPDNYLTCNYVVGPVTNCIFLDYATALVRVDGAVCVNNARGLKLNTGHINSVAGMVVVNPSSGGGFIANQLSYSCTPGSLGSLWQQQFLSKLSSSSFNNAYPQLSTICSEETVTVQGSQISCNLPGGYDASVTGGCSGVPTENSWEVVVVAPRGSLPSTYLNTNNLPAVPLINEIYARTYYGPSVEVAEKTHSLRFYDSANGDFGIYNDSMITSGRPGFRSCPRATCGPQLISPAQFHSAFFANS
eukprot:SM000002S05701  [mRNA]  locus=s2:1755869:1758613:+ [translate_table: standard]